MDIREEFVGEIAVVRLKGRLTLGDGTTRLKDKINSLLLEDVHDIVLNLAHVSSIDSAGLGQLVSSFTGVSRAGGRLSLVHVGGRSRDLLATTKLLTVFDTYESEEEAVASYRHATATIAGEVAR